MRLILVIPVFLLACSSERPRAPLDFVRVCSPGGRINTCDHALREVHAPVAKRVLPAGDLVDMHVMSVLIAEEGIPYLLSHRGAFRHQMQFRTAYGTVRARVVALLEQELGPKLNTGRPPIADPLVISGDYWMTADGYWIVTDVDVTWYGNPVAFKGEAGLFTSPGHPDAQQNVRPAPVSNPLWNKLGRLLVTY